MLDAEDVKRDVAQERLRIEEQHEWLGDNANDASKPSDQRLIELDLIDNLLSVHPDERKTAAQMAAVFDGDVQSTPEDAAELLENVPMPRVMLFPIVLVVFSSLKVAAG